MKLTQRAAAGIALALLFIAPATVKADETSQNISIAKYITNLKINGDIRLRQENFWKSSRGQVDRSRQRFRLRLGIQPQIQDVTIGLRLASGQGEQVSTNQSFDNLSNQKPFFIDQAYVQWKVFEWMKLSGGKMQNPLWRVYSSDIVWDDDFNPEGFAQQFDKQLGERFGLFANFMQMVLDEDSSAAPDQWYYAFQLGARTKLFQETKFNFATSLYYLSHENDNDFSQAGTAPFPPNVNEGNSRIGNTNTLRSSFTVVHVTTELNTRLFRWPLSLQADYANNIADNGVLLSSSSQKVAYQVGAILGKASARNTWEVAYFFKWSEQDSTLADLADSDFGDGGTNRRGHIFWVAYSPRDYMQIKAKALSTEVIRTAVAPGPDNVNRFQLDVSVKF